MLTSCRTVCLCYISCSELSRFFSFFKIKNVFLNLFLPNKVGHNSRWIGALLAWTDFLLALQQPLQKWELETQQCTCTHTVTQNLILQYNNLKKSRTTNGPMADWSDTYTQNFTVFAIKELSDLKNINSFHPTLLCINVKVTMDSSFFSNKVFGKSISYYSYKNIILVNIF